MTLKTVDKLFVMRGKITSYSESPIRVFTSIKFSLPC
jgi:hypothetical protein